MPIGPCRHAGRAIAGPVFVTLLPAMFLCVTRAVLMPGAGQPPAGLALATAWLSPVLAKPLSRVDKTL
jgi:hypothetical protein